MSRRMFTDVTVVKLPAGTLAQVHELAERRGTRAACIMREAIVAVVVTHAAPRPTARPARSAPSRREAA